jgi:hypothetical protein
VLPCAQYGEMLQQKRLALEARCGEGNVTAAAMDIEFVKVCVVLRSCLALLAGDGHGRNTACLPRLARPGRVPCLRAGALANDDTQLMS